ncbi:MAG: ABC transporter substrate-binding protein [Cellulosilyticaceae bacterium]
MKKYIYLVGCLLVVASLAVGCGSTDGIVTPNDELEASVHIGVLPTVDAAPIYLAHENGYFKEKGLDVTIETLPYDELSYKSPSFDAQIISPVEALVGAKGKHLLKTDTLYRLMALPKQEEKDTYKIATVKGSYNEYLLDTEMDAGSLEKVYVGQDVLSYTLLQNEEVDMALLPEPLAGLAEQTGMVEKEVVFKESVANVLVGVKNEKAFREAYDLAVKQINENPEIGKAVLLQHLGIEDEVGQKVQLPSYKVSEMPDASWLEKIAEWAQRQLEMSFM